MTKKKSSCFSILLVCLCGLSVIGSLSCSRLFPAPDEGSNNKILFQEIATTNLSVNEQLTINVDVENMRTPVELTWSATNGELTATSGYTSVFTAPQTADTVIIVVEAKNSQERVTADLMLTILPPDTIPPAKPSNVSGISTDNGIILSWSHLNEPDLKSFTIFFAKQSHYYQDGQFLDHVVIEPQNEYTLSNLENNTMYAIAIAATDTAREPNFSELSDIIFKTPIDSVSPPAPTFFKAVPEENQIRLKWKNPSDKDFKGVILLRKEGPFFSNHENDGTVLISKENLFTQEEFIDTDNILEGKQYFYSIYAFDDEPLNSKMPSTANAIILP